MKKKKKKNREKIHSKKKQKREENQRKTAPARKARRRALLEKKREPERLLAFLSERIKELFSAESLREKAEKRNWSKRTRKIKPESFFTNIILGVSDKGKTQIDEIIRDYNQKIMHQEKDIENTVTRQSFQNKLAATTTGDILKDLLLDAMKILRCSVEKLIKSSGLKKIIDDVVCADGTYITLSDDLEDEFPGTGGEKGAKSQICIRSAISLEEDNIVHFDIKSGTEHESKGMIGYLEEVEIRRKLFLMDRAYDSRELALDIRKLGGYSLTRLRCNSNPTLKNVLVDGKRAPKFDGWRMNEVLESIHKGASLDAYIDDGSEDSILRIVVVWNPNPKKDESNWNRMQTTLPRESAGVKELINLYRLRWQIEIVFKEMKSYSNLGKIKSKKKQTTLNLIYACILSFFLKRFLAVLSQVFIKGTVISSQKVASCGEPMLSILFISARDGCADEIAKAIVNVIFKFLAKVAKRSNPHRDLATGKYSCGIEIPLSG